MAWDFFQVSPTYRRRVSPKVQKRRAIIASFCDHNYRVFRGSGQKAVIKVETEIAGSSWLLGTLYQDASAYKNVMSWLKGEKTENTLGTTPHAIAKCFKKDGLTSWKDVLAKKSEVSRKTTAKPESPATGEIGNKATQKAHILLAELQSVLETLEEELTETEKVKASWLIQERELLAKIAHQGKEISGLTMYLDTATQPDEPIKERVPKNDPPQESDEVAGTKENRLSEKLANRSSFYGCPIRYSNNFVRNFLGMSNEDQDKVLSAISILAEKGSSYNSLGTNPIPSYRQAGVPKGSMSSRASRELRFYWHLNKDKKRELQILDVSRRGDSIIYNEQ